MVELSGMYKGNYTILTDYQFSVGKVIGFGRIMAPKEIIFKPDNRSDLKCKF